MRTFLVVVVVASSLFSEAARAHPHRVVEDVVAAPRFEPIDLSHVSVPDGSEVVVSPRESLVERGYVPAPLRIVEQELLAVVGIVLNPNKRVEFSNCAAAGSASADTEARSYVFRVTDEDIFLCYAATCAAGGERFPVGTVMHIQFTSATTLSCRSTSSTGDAIFTAGN